jgi:hypothetical protein
MKTQFHNMDLKTEEYTPNHGSTWGFNPPCHVTNFSQRWTNDLITSVDHSKQLPLDDPKQNVGGPFYAVKREYSARNTLGGDPHQAYIFAPPGGRYGGLVITPVYARYASVNNSHFPSISETDPAYLQHLIRVAIEKTVPNKSAWDGSTFAAEMREGLPHIIPFAQTAKGRTARANRAGGEYLNVEFGWKPLLRDYSKFSDAIKNAEKILDDYEKGSGKPIRRKYKFPTEFNVEVYEENGFVAPLLDQTSLWTNGNYYGDLRKTTTTRVRRWFSAMYMYYFPPRGDPSRKTSELNRLYGTDITPNTLWNAAPWSWAIDWFADVGTTMSNLSAFQTDCLVMPYAYLMEEKSVEVEYQLSNITWYDVSGLGNNGPHTLWQTFKTTTKSRIPAASPYGFYAEWPDLSGQQLAILAALGLK